ncbi:hypothetical protein [Sphingomonas sp. MMS24-J13]|uniref:hypothetical protein n=1 Tax=Sphingomonas sp. MMS24-J13 TaxID=3238686 RepID=UPI00384F2CCA
MTDTIDIGALIRERDDADRRAGAAERRSEQLAESASARELWLRQAKQDAGFSDNTSFDAVWRIALEALREKRSQPPAIDSMPVLDNGLSTVIEGALAIVRKHDSGMSGLIFNLIRLQRWLSLYVARARAGELSPGSGDAMRNAAIAAVELAMEEPDVFGGDFGKGRTAGLREARNILLEAG